MGAEMRQIVLRIAFDGGAYHGFQLQPGAVTVQQRLEEAASRLFSKERVVMHGCSRTDAGVSAREFYCTFAVETALSPAKIKLALLALLPKDITVYDCYFTEAGFHPRFAAQSKRYSYTIRNTPSRDPFLGRYQYSYYRKLDEKRMDAAAQLFVGRHDFRGFMSAGSSVLDTVREVYECTVRREGDLLRMEIEADGFLYNMVRIIAGTLVYVSEGKIALSDLPGIIASGRRELAGPTLPGRGLCLERVNLAPHRCDRGEERCLEEEQNRRG